jgi:predicted nucleic acid-binding Zn ribbon protein
VPDPEVPDEGTQPRVANQDSSEDSSGHDDTGLDLARSIARGLAKPGLRRPRGKAGGRGRRVQTRSSGAHPDERDPQLLDATVGRLIAEQGWSSDIRVHGVFSRWDTIVGREVAQHCAPESFEQTDTGGRLVVRTDSTAWATQVRLLAPTVVRRLNEELGEATVTLVEVVGPHGPSWKRGPRSVRDGRGPRDTYG